MIKQILFVATYIIRTLCGVTAAYLYDMKYPMWYVILAGILYLIFEYCSLNLQGDVHIYNLEKIEKKWKNDSKKLKQAKNNRGMMILVFAAIIFIFFSLLYENLTEEGVYVITSYVILGLGVLDELRFVYLGGDYINMLPEENKETKRKRK